MSEEKKYEQKEKSGALWVDNNAQILRKGSILWKSASPDNDGKDEKRYFALVESENNHGKKKLELLMSVGLVFVNENKFSEDIMLDNLESYFQETLNAHSSLAPP